MARFTRKDVLVAALEALIAGFETNAFVKAGATFVAKLGGRIKDLPDDEWAALATAKPREIQDALTQLNIISGNAALAATGVKRVEDLCTPLAEAIENQSQDNQTILKRIDGLRAILEDQLDRERLRGDAVRTELNVSREKLVGLTEGVMGVHQMLKPFADRSPELKELSEWLAGLVARYEHSTSPQQYSETDDLRIRLAKAAVANAELRSWDALNLVTEADAKLEREKTDRQMQIDAEVNRTRGAAFYELQEWTQARDCYQRVVELQPQELEAQMSLANIMCQLNAFDAALNLFDNIIVIYTKKANDNNEMTSDLAMAYNNRGNLYRRIAKYVRSLDDFQASIKIYWALVGIGGFLNLRDDLATVFNNRGIAYLCLGNHDHAIKDQSEAIRFYQTLIKHEHRLDLRSDLAMVYNNRGNARENNQEHREAIEDYTEAISLYSVLIGNEGRKELRNFLAGVYNNRSIAHQNLKNSYAAVLDANAAIELYGGLIRDEKYVELRNELAMAYNNRGNAYHSLGKLHDATKDFDAALELYGILIEEEGREELRRELAGALFNRADLLRLTFKFEAAIRDYDQAILSFRLFVQEAGRLESLHWLYRAAMEREITRRLMETNDEQVDGNPD